MTESPRRRRAGRDDRHGDHRHLRRRTEDTSKFHRSTAIGRHRQRRRDHPGPGQRGGGGKRAQHRRPDPRQLPGDSRSVHHGFRRPDQPGPGERPRRADGLDVQPPLRRRARSDRRHAHGRHRRRGRRGHHPALPGRQRTPSARQARPPPSPSPAGTSFVDLGYALLHLCAGPAGRGTNSCSAARPRRTVGCCRRPAASSSIPTQLSPDPFEPSSHPVRSGQRGEPVHESHRSPNYIIGHSPGIPHRRFYRRRSTIRRCGWRSTSRAQGGEPALDLRAVRRVRVRGRRQEHDQQRDMRGSLPARRQHRADSIFRQFHRLRASLGTGDHFFGPDQRLFRDQSQRLPTADPD